jgi:hypothetical protein
MPFRIKVLGTLDNPTGRLDASRVLSAMGDVEVPVDKARLNRTDRRVLLAVRLTGLVATVVATMVDTALGIVVAYVATSVFLVRCRRTQ